MAYEIATRSIPPDTQVVSMSVKESQEYWHLPRSVWGSINKKATGKGIVIANLDTGINPRHRLLPKPIASRSFVPSERDVIDRHGHGSHTCGTNAGRDPRISPAFEADLIVGKVLGANGEGDSRWIAEGINWAVGSGAHIISLSLGGPDADNATTEAINAANDQGVLVVCAAGNDGYRGIDTIGFPGRHHGCVCVGAYRMDGRIASFSSGGRQIDLACPGEEIVSCSHTSPDRLVSMSGTSMATPYAAALFALVLELVMREGGAWPKRDWWTSFIADNCDDAGDPGVDDRFGAGVPRYTGIVEKLNNGDLKWT